MNMSMPESITLQCSKCGAVFSRPDGSLMFSRDYWWHIPCCNNTIGKGTELIVDFPSCGKLIPTTIVTETDES